MPLDSGSVNEDKTLGSSSSGCHPLSTRSNNRFINKEQQDIIDRLVSLLDAHESPSEEHLKRIKALDDCAEDCTNRFQYILEMQVLNVQRLIKFMKKVPGLDTISRQDQIKLLQRSSREVMELCTARKYDMMTDSIYTQLYTFTRKKYHEAGLGSSADSLFDFYRTMCFLEVDDVEYALLIAIVIFSECPCLLEPKKVEMIQEGYIEILKKYVFDNRPPGKNYFARLLSILAELRVIISNMDPVCNTNREPDLSILRDEGLLLEI